MRLFSIFQTLFLLVCSIKQEVQLQGNHVWVTDIVIEYLIIISGLLLEVRKKFHVIPASTQIMF